MAARSAYRCEIDLSPGGRTRPRTRGVGCTMTVWLGMEDDYNRCRYK
jgi:hypothetical protein